MGSKYKVPDNVVDKELYAKIKREIDAQLDKEGRRWSIYSSSQLVGEYKRRGGRYKGKKSQDGLNRWFREDWIDTCKLPKKVQCGREDLDKPFPYCRPLNRVSKDTPKTVKEIGRRELARRCKAKRRKEKKKLSR